MADLIAVGYPGQVTAGEARRLAADLNSQPGATAVVPAASGTRRQAVLADGAA